MYTLNGLAIGLKSAQPIATPLILLAILTAASLAIPTAVSLVISITIPSATLINTSTTPILPSAPTIPSPPST